MRREGIIICKTAEGIFVVFSGGCGENWREVLAEIEFVASSRELSAAQCRRSCDPGPKIRIIRLMDVSLPMGTPGHEARSIVVSLLP